MHEHVLSSDMLTYARLDEKLEKHGVSLRLIREHNRLRALRLMDSLTEGYDRMNAVPESHPDLDKIRFWLGGYEDACTETDITELQHRLMHIAAVTHVPVNVVLQDVSGALDLSVTLFWKKMSHNEFTVLERRQLWNYVSDLEERHAIVKKVDSLPNSTV